MLKKHRTTFILLLILFLALGLRIYNLSAIQDGNTYYAAAVKSMLTSWQNFFFVSAEPGGSVSVDKPPLGLWIQAASAAVFGVNGVAMALPQVLAGVLSVWVLYRLVRKHYGEAAGLIAAGILAVTPVTLTADRSNLLESTLLLSLLLAAWAFLKAVETGKLRHLLLGGLLVGLGFNIKMMEAFLPLPAFYLLYFLATRRGWWKKIAQLVLAGVFLLAVSLSWALVVDLTPAEARPYVGGSTENSVLELAIGYNGISRLVGMGRGPGSGQLPGGMMPPGGGQNLPPMGQGNPPGNLPDYPNRPQGDLPGGLPSGMPLGNNTMFGGETGSPGLLRLFTVPLAREIGWLLPLALASLLLLLLSERVRLPLGTVHQGAALWGGWLLAGGVFFSVAGFFHAYYLILLAPPLAALVGAGTMRLWALLTARPKPGAAALALVGGLGLLYQYSIARVYTADLWWMLLALVLVLIGTALAFLHPRREWLSRAGFGAVLLALLIPSFVWSLLGAINTAPNAMVPGSYSGGNGTSGVGMMAGIGGMESVNQELIDYLQSHTQDVEYLMAVPSANDGSRYVLATGRPVLFMGGFNGSDPVVDAADLAQLVAEKRLRYVWLSSGSMQMGSQNIYTWLESSCTEVTEIDLSPALQRPGGGNLPNLPEIKSALYRCGD